MEGTRLATIGLAQTCGQAQAGVSDAGYIYPAHLPPLLSSIIVILSHAWVSTVYLPAFPPSDIVLDSYLATRM
jgi:hypothetical protein